MKLLAKQKLLQTTISYEQVIFQLIFPKSKKEKIFN